MPSKKKKKTPAPTYGTCEHFAGCLGVSKSDPEKHVRLVDENEPGLAEELAAFVVKWKLEEPQVRRPVHAEFCAQYLPQFFAAFDGLPPATTAVRISVLHSYAALWSIFNGHAHISRYLVHHPNGREVSASILKQVDGCTPAKAGPLTEPFMDILGDLGVLLKLTVAVYRYHMPARIETMPVLPLDLVQSSISVLDRYAAGMRTRIRMKPNTQPLYLARMSHCLGAVSILGHAAQPPARERNEWPEGTSAFFGNLNPWSFPEVRCEANIGWIGIRDDALVEEGGPCVELEEEGARFPFLCNGCQAVSYCSAEHQKFHWDKQHKYECYKADTGERSWKGKN